MSVKNLSVQSLTCHNHVQIGKKTLVLSILKCEVSHTCGTDGQKAFDFLRSSASRPSAYIKTLFLQVIWIMAMTFKSLYKTCLQYTIFYNEKCKLHACLQENLNPSNKNVLNYGNCTLVFLHILYFRRKCLINMF